MALFVLAIFQAHALTYSVTVPASTNECFIVGEMNNWTQQPMTKVDATHFTIEIASATKIQKYKYCSGPGWGYMEWDPNSQHKQIDRQYVENDTVTQWASIYDKTHPDTELTYTVTVPEGTKSCFIAGGWDGWHQFSEMKKVNDNTFAVTFKSNIALKYVYLLGADWKLMELKTSAREPNVRSYSANDVIENWNTLVKPK